MDSWAEGTTKETTGLLAPKRTYQAIGSLAGDDDEGAQRERGRMLRLLYFSSFLSAWGNRMWEFAVPILLTSVFTDSLLPASAFPFATQLACVIFGTMMGKMVDDMDRKRVITLSLITQNVCVLLCAVILYFILPFGAPHPPLGNWHFDALFAALVFVGAIAALASMVEEIAVGRDWVVVITDGDREALTGTPLPPSGAYSCPPPPSLAHTKWTVAIDANATVTRISLFCKVAAPVAFSLVMAFTSRTVCLVFVGAWNAVSIVPEIWALLRVYGSVPALQKTLQSASSSSGNAFATLWAGWAIYISSQRIFLVSFAYTLLYWTALSPGALMSAYLLTHGINEIYIALYTGASSVVGMIPTFFTSTLFKRFGIEKTGMYAIWGQDACLLVCVVFFFVPNFLHLAGLLSGDGPLDGAGLAGSFLAEYSTPYNWSIWAFLLFLILSRMGLWTFDLAERQIMQEYVPEESRGMVNAVEYSLTNVFSLLSYGMGMVFYAPQQFGILVLISFGVVTVAALCYTQWRRSGALLRPPPSPTLPSAQAIEEA